MNLKEKKEHKKIKLADKCRDFNWVNEQFEANKLRLHGQTITKEAFDKFRLAVKTAQEVYENEWDLALKVGEASEGFIYDIRGLVIRFSKLTISNSKRKTHDIEELFVKINLYPSGTNLRIEGLKGGRMKISYAEYCKGYFHSHLPSGVSAHYNVRDDYGEGVPYFQTFCRGSGHINDFIAEINSQTFTVTRFTPFLVQILGLVSWESLEGGPHKRFGNVSVTGNSGRASNPGKTTSLNHLNQILAHHRATNIIPVLDFAWESGFYSIVDNEKLDKFISESIEISDASKRNIVCMQDNRGNYYQWGSIPGFNEPRTITQKYIFQGQELEFVIQPAPNVGDTDEITYFVHPNVKKYIKEQLEYDINIKKIRESTIKRYSNKTGHTKESPRPDKVAV